jgi:hypothetical protein
MHVEEGDEVVILIDLIRGDRSGDDLAEDALLHEPISAWPGRAFAASSSGISVIVGFLTAVPEPPAFPLFATCLDPIARLVWRRNREG